MALKVYKRYVKKMVSHAFNKFCAFLFCLTCLTVDGGRVGLMVCKIVARGCWEIPRGLGHSLRGGGLKKEVWGIAR